MRFHVLPRGKWDVTYEIDCQISPAHPPMTVYESEEYTSFMIGGPYYQFWQELRWQQ